MKEKAFYVISALRQDSSPLGVLKRFATEKEAIAHAQNVIDRRHNEGQPAIGFYVLKVEVFVETVKSPVKVVRLAKTRPAKRKKKA